MKGSTSTSFVVFIATTAAALNGRSILNAADLVSVTTNNQSVNDKTSAKTEGVKAWVSAIFNAVAYYVIYCLGALYHTKRTRATQEPKAESVVTNCLPEQPATSSEVDQQQVVVEPQPEETDTVLVDSDCTEQPEFEPTGAEKEEVEAQQAATSIKMYTHEFIMKYKPSPAVVDTAKQLRYKTIVGEVKQQNKKRMQHGSASSPKKSSSGNLNSAPRAIFETLRKAAETAQQQQPALHSGKKVPVYKAQNQRHTSSVKFPSPPPSPPLKPTLQAPSTPLEWRAAFGSASPAVNKSKKSVTPFQNQQKKGHKACARAGRRENS